MAKRANKKRAINNGIKRFKRQRLLNRFAEPGRFESRLVLDGLHSDFNIGKIFRSADAFGVSRVHLVSIPAFNPVSAMGSFQWVPASFHDSIEPAIDELTADGYTIYALAPQAEDILGSAPLPRRSAFILGHEEYGLSFELSDYPQVKTLRMQQFGKVQSLNVSVAASIALYEYARQHSANTESECG